MRTLALFGGLILLLAACSLTGAPGGVAMNAIDQTPPQPSRDQVVVALQERLEREPLMLCPGVSLTSSCEWIEQGDTRALFPPETVVRVANPTPLASVDLAADPMTWEVCYRLEGSDTLYMTRLSSAELGLESGVGGVQTAGLFEPVYPTVRVYRLGEPGYDTVALRCDDALSNRGQKASAW